MIDYNNNNTDEMTGSTGSVWASPSIHSVPFPRLRAHLFLIDRLVCECVWNHQLSRERRVGGVCGVWIASPASSCSVNNDSDKTTAERQTREKRKSLVWFNETSLGAHWLSKKKIKEKEERWEFLLSLMMYESVVVCCWACCMCGIILWWGEGEGEGKKKRNRTFPLLFLYDFLSFSFSFSLSWSPNMK